MLEKKRCSKCGVPKEKTCFYKDSTKKDGVKTYCKECESKIRKEKYMNKKMKNIIKVEDLDGEVWKDVQGYEGLYQASNLGRVKSLSRITSNGSTTKERILKKNKTNQGYCRVTLFRCNEKNTISTHRLIAQTFIPNPLKKPCVDHINTIRDDNRVENLRWATHKENTNNCLTWEKRMQACKSESFLKKISEKSKGRKHKETTLIKMSKKAQGEGNSQSKLTTNDVLKIRKLHTNGIKTRDIAKMYGMSIKAIRRIVKRQSWRNI